MSITDDIQANLDAYLKVIDSMTDEERHRFMARLLAQMSIVTPPHKWNVALRLASGVKP